ncbi:TPR end-of-group domain-containing protein [Lutimonas vermicola]|uniref:Adenylate/guanylate cyclase domain-containing protein n=1 Tax=Lutimonas vermicola TaxID=414288 RepID=A0ABU9L4F9_9FLAO
MPQNRQLAAIMFTDIVGYTALMGNDEEGAFRILSKNRELQKPIIEQYNGKWIKELGDGVMVSFNTVSDAVNAAIRIQKESLAVPGLHLTIGIHLGEVVFENEDVFGDGVNIAARIQAFAIPDSIYISEAIHNNISNKQGIETSFVKQVKLKNVNSPMRLYEVVTAPKKDSSQIPITGSTQESSGKSIAVLPFTNMSNDPDQDYFCDGISEEIIDTLAQLNNLRVIARTSSFSFKEKNLDVREIGRTLDVTTLLEGSVRKSGNRLRITTKLVSVSDGSHLWTNRYDRELEDIFAIQEDIAKNVATELKGFLTSYEKEVIRPQKTAIQAYEYFLKGIELFHQLNLLESKIMFEKSIKIDPDYAPSHAGLSDVFCQIYEWHGGNNDDLALAENHSFRALSISPNMAESHASYGFVLSLRKRYDEAEKEFIEAIRLNPNSFDAYYRYARYSFSRGHIEKSAEMFLKASEVRLEDFQSLLLLAQSLRILGKNEAAKALKEGLIRVRKHLELNPTDRRALSLGAVSLFENGEKEKAMKWINKAVELYPEDGGVIFNGACLYAKDGNKKKAISLLEVAVEKGYGNKEWIERDHDYDSLRNEPRFIALIKKLNEKYR